MPRIIALLTDFGTRDPFVGIMKGVILGISPQSILVDITHAIPPQDIAAARFALLQAHPFFPRGTVFVVVVDPGVGSSRRAIALRNRTGIFVAPDNGVLSEVLDQDPPQEAVSLTRPEAWRSLEPCPTFHGRDIFAPVAAHLAAGKNLAEVGTPIAAASLAQIHLPDPEFTATGISGTVQAVDHFGNIITNVPGKALQGRNWRVTIQALTIHVRQTYADVDPGGLVALIGSHGFLEIAVAQGNAAQKFGIGPGQKLFLLSEPSA